MSSLAETSRSHDSPSDTTPSDSQRSSLLVLWVMRAMALLATIVCGYLVWVALSGGDAAGCGGTMDCDEVLRSKWSKWFGLPVSIPAMSLYVTVLLTLVFAGPRAPENVRDLAWTAIAGMTALTAAAGVLFVWLQLFSVNELCTWCITIHACGCGLFLLTLVAGYGTSLKKLVSAGLVASLGMAALVPGMFGQEETKSGMVSIDFEESTTAPMRFDLSAANIESTDNAGSETNQPNVTDDPTSSPSGISFSDLDGFRVTPNKTTSGSDPLVPPSIPDVSPPEKPTVAVIPAEAPVDLSGSGEVAGPQRVLRVLGGAVELNAYQYPVVGSYEADHVIIKLFDYTCSHCRKMHHDLEEVQAAAPGKIAVLMLAVPLNSACNPNVSGNNPTHESSCQLAALSLAVWEIDAAKFPEYHHWLMSGDRPPELAAAKAQAVELVGEQLLEQRLADPALWRRLAVGPKVYGFAKRGVVPKLLLPKVMITGNATSRDDLFNMLSRHLEMPELKQ